jgi:hypothetical protein
MSLGKELMKIYGERNINTLMNFTKSGGGYLSECSKSFFIDMKKVETIKDRNRKFALQTQIKKNLKSFLDDIFENSIPSPNLVAFYTGIELDIIISKFIEIDASFPKEVSKDEKLDRDYKTLTSQLRDSVTMTIEDKHQFSEEVKDSFRRSSTYLGKMLVRTYMYNEFMYNHNTLLDILNENNKIYYEKYEFEWENLDFASEKDLCNQIYYRIEMIRDFFQKDIERMKSIIPDKFDNDMKYIRTTITKLKKSLELFRREIDLKVAKKVSKYQKFSGMNLKNWKKELKNDC